MFPHNLLVFVLNFLPGGINWAYIVGAAFILVSVSFLTNRMVKIAGYKLAVLLFIFILSIHVPNYLNAGDKEMRQMALVNILKDIAILALPYMWQQVLIIRNCIWKNPINN